MLRTLWEWLWPPHCDHQWVEKHKSEAWSVDMFGQSSKHPCKYIFVYACEKCGRWQKVTLP